jgi:hypothetical protein
MKIKEKQNIKKERTTFKEVICSIFNLFTLEEYFNEVEEVLVESKKNTKLTAENIKLTMALDKAINELERIMNIVPPPKLCDNCGRVLEVGDTVDLCWRCIDKEESYREEPENEEEK